MPKYQAFSLLKYLCIVFALSWPFQFIYLWLGDAFRPVLLISMVMAGVATFIAGKFVFKDGFARTGWSFGKPKHYIFALLLALCLWLLPSLIERYFGMFSGASNVSLTSFLSTLLVSSLITILPAFGEEFSWRGYLLPRLQARYTPRKALLLHGLVTWLWHLPVLVAMGLAMGGNPVVSLLLILIISLIPTVMHAVVFAYIWSSSKSLVVATFYHVMFDEIRDTLEGTVGLGVLGQNFQMLVLTVLGLVILWKTKAGKEAE